MNTLLPFGGALWGYVNDRKVVYHAHEVSISPAPLRWFLLKVAKISADQVFYVSRDQYDRLPVEGVKATVLPNPITAEITQMGERTPYAVQRTGAFRALMIANPRDYKGIPEFIELARRFIDCKRVQFTLVLNAEPGEISRYLPAEERPTNVSIYPRTDDPGQFYATADVLLNLSRVDMVVETFGLTIVEALSFGVPVIVPPLGGPTEIVTDGVEGHLADSRDLDHIEELLCGMIGDPKGMLRMSRAARLRAKEFALERFANSLKREVLGLTQTARQS